MQSRSGINFNCSKMMTILSSMAFLVLALSVMISSVYSEGNKGLSESLPSLDLNSDISKDNSTCEDVRHLYITKNIGSVEDTTDSQHEGEESPLCATSWNISCCTPSMERHYSVASKKEFQEMLQSSNAFLRDLLGTSTAKFSDNFLEMVYVSQNNTNILFSEVYKKMDSSAREPVSRLYADLVDYIHGQTVELEARISAFFDALFPLVYHHSINPKLKDFSEDYKECLRQTQQEIRPFGDIADRVSLHVTRAFGVARTLLDSFKAGYEVIQATDHMQFRPECNAVLTKMVYCSQCRGFLRAKPCSGYCLNVVRGCLANVAELDQPWSDYVSSMERLTSGLVGSYNIEEVLSVLDTKISEAIMYAMENGPELSRKVKIACGHPRRATRDILETSTAPMVSAPGRIMSVRSSEDSLYHRLQQVIQKLTASKGHYANLADIVCSDESWAVREEGQCWNSESLGQYTQTIAGVGVAAQRYNPEMKAPESDDITVMALDEKLQRMSRQLRTSITPDLPQSDSYMVEGSGSGSTRYRFSDDEDYDNGSGSGDWGGTKASDFNFDSGDTKDVNIKVADNSAISFTSSSVLLISTVLLVSLLLPSFSLRSY